MNDKEIEQMRAMNFRLLTLLGMVSALIGIKIRNPEKDEEWKWFFRAIEDVVYKNKSIPPIGKIEND